MQSRKLALIGSVAALSVAAVPVTQAVAATQHHADSRVQHVDRSRDLKHADRNSRDRQGVDKQSQDKQSHDKQSHDKRSHDKQSPDTQSPNQSSPDQQSR